MTPLAAAIAAAIESALSSPDGAASIRGLVVDEEWKIAADYDARSEIVRITAKRRDPEVNQWLNA